MNTPSNPTAAAPDHLAKVPQKRSGKGVLLALIAVCVAPVIASYAAYYWLQPGGRTNYGQLVAPQVDVASLQISPLVIAPPLPAARVLPIQPNTPARLGAFKGRWVMVVPASASCADSCAERLYNMRQVRLTTGKHRDRIERLWLVPDAQMPAADLLKDHAGMWVAAIDPSLLRAQFPSVAASENGPASVPTDHIYLIDPLGHLMMRFPLDADPSRMKKDMLRLLKASRIG